MEREGLGRRGKFYEIARCQQKSSKDMFLGRPLIKWIQYFLLHINLVNISCSACTQFPLDSQFGAATDCCLIPGLHYVVCSMEFWEQDRAPSNPLAQLLADMVFLCVFEFVSPSTWSETSPVLVYDITLLMTDYFGTSLQLQS